MQKHIKPACHHPKAGETVSLTLTHTVQVQNQEASVIRKRPVNAVLKSKWK